MNYIDIHLSNCDQAPHGAKACCNLAKLLHKLEVGTIVMSDKGLRGSKLAKYINKYAAWMLS